MVSETSRVAFYIGILCMLVAMIIRLLNVDIIGLSGSSVLKFAECWFLITICILLFGLFSNSKVKKD